MNMKRSFSIHAQAKGETMGLQYHIIDTGEARGYETHINATTIELCQGY